MHDTAIAVNMVLLTLFSSCHCRSCCLYDTAAVFAARSFWLLNAKIPGAGGTSWWHTQEP